MMPTIRINTMTRYGIPKLIDGFQLKEGFILGLEKGNLAYDILTESHINTLITADKYYRYRFREQYDNQLKLKQFGERCTIWDANYTTAMRWLRRTHKRFDFIYCGAVIFPAKVLWSLCLLPTLVTGVTRHPRMRSKTRLTSRAEQLARRFHSPLYLTSEPDPMWWFIIS